MKVLKAIIKFLIHGAELKENEPYVHLERDGLL